ncbi:hypothetical protein F4778DRAFT_173146 [Xylariomycetidae sp. FL2044]|nr:hypothetical protein F4778DRAFT_173146 [Xylariomycetidae sp. FL2044]
MPRPKKSHTAAATPTRPAKATTPAPAPEPSAAPSSDIYDVSPREKAKAAERRISLREVTATRTQSKSSATLEQARVLEIARRRADDALDRVGNITSTTSDEDDVAMDKSASSIEMGRRASATPLHGRRTTDLSGLDLDDDMFDDLNTTYDTAGPASAHRSAETSTLSVTHFKRRPRAGSFLSRDDGPIRPSSRAGPNTPGLSSTFNIGVFKRRQREPSILGTAQKPRPQRPEPELESESGDEQDEEGLDEDDFAPEAESTPFKHSKRRSGEAEAGETSSGAKSRKRKSTEGHERRVRSSPYGISDPAPGAEEQPDSDDELSLPSLPQELSRPMTPVMDEHLMAPPLSSGSSENEQEMWPPLQSLARGRARRPASGLRRTPVRDNVSDISSPPSLTYSPNYAEPTPPPKPAVKTRRRAASKPEPKVTTADLTGLLPRRRHKGARGDDLESDSDGEVDISGLGDNDDELAYLDVRTRRRPASRPTSRAGNQSRNRNRNPVSSRSKAKQSSGSAKAAVRTYGRLSDKENQGGEEEQIDVDGAEEVDDESLGAADHDAEEEENSEDMVARMGDELKKAARKFQEVDKWELEYEEMTQSSSPVHDAR